MRLVVFLLAVMLSVPMAMGQNVEEPATWIMWSDDGEETPSRLAAGDIDVIDVAPTGQGLHLRLTTFASNLPPAAPASQVVFQLAQGESREVQVAWNNGASVAVGGAFVEEGWTVADGSSAIAWHVFITWAALDVLPAQDIGLLGLDAFARSGGLTDPATGPDLTFTASANGDIQATVASIAPGETIEGPDYGGGTSITVDPAGRPLVAYYIYDADRGDARGIYLASVDGAFQAERIGETMITRENGRDQQMRTQIAHDGTATFVLFTDDPAVDNDEDGPGHLGTPDTVYVLAKQGDSWVREDPTPGGDSDVGPEDVSDLAARDGKLVAAVPVASDVWIVERTGPDAWQERARLEGANNAKLVIDSNGVVHAAYVTYSADGNLRDGQLFYASSADDYAPTHIGDNIEAGWEEPETDGSFAIAAGPSDEIAILWNDGRADRDEEQKVKILQGGAWSQEVVPLVPGHGNPQYTMRLGYTSDGVLVASSGYGGTDTLAVRGGHGAWSALSLPRYDVWDMAVAPAGSIFFGYTQPHGGTTVAVSAYGVGVNAETADDVAMNATESAMAEPEPGEQIPALGMTAILGLLVVAARRRR